MTFPETVISLAIQPKSRGDRDKLGQALTRLSRRKTRRSRSYTDDETGDTIISGMGELHLEVLISRLLSEFKIECEVGKPRVAYRQTIRKDVEVEGKHVKQSGGRGQFGVARVRVSQHDETENTFENNIVGGSIPKEYIPAVEKGLMKACEVGKPLGFPFVKLHFDLYDGKYHDVDSSEMAFQEAGRLVLKEAIEKGGISILEPWMKITITTPENNLGDVLGTLNQRRGHVDKTERGSGDAMRIYGFVPLAEMFKYSEVLRGMTQGRGVYTMEPHEYRLVPSRSPRRSRRRSSSARRRASSPLPRLPSPPVPGASVAPIAHARSGRLLRGGVRCGCCCSSFPSSSPAAAACSPSTRSPASRTRPSTSA